MPITLPLSLTHSCIRKAFALISICQSFPNSFLYEVHATDVIYTFFLPVQRALRQWAPWLLLLANIFKIKNSRSLLIVEVIALKFLITGGLENLKTDIAVRKQEKVTPEQREQQR